MIKDFFRRIKRVIDFLPTIWKGYDFDFYYSIELFKHQLERQAKFFESSKSYRQDSLHQASRIRTVIKLMDIVYNEKYHDETNATMERIYGQQRFEFIENKDIGMYSLDIRWEKAMDDEHNEAIMKLWSDQMKFAANKTKRAHGILWRMVEHNIKNWWD